MSIPCKIATMRRFIQNMWTNSWKDSIYCKFAGTTRSSSKGSQIFQQDSQVDEKEWDPSCLSDVEEDPWKYENVALRTRASKSSWLRPQKDHLNCMQVILSNPWWIYFWIHIQNQHRCLLTSWMIDLIFHLVKVTLHNTHFILGIPRIPVFWVMWCQLNGQQFWPPGVWDISGHWTPAISFPLLAKEFPSIFKVI